MQPPNLRYYAFVERFVDAIATDALTESLRRMRRNQLPALPPVTAPRPVMAEPQREAA